MFFIIHGYKMYAEKSGKVGAVTDAKKTSAINHLIVFTFLFLLIVSFFPLDYWAQATQTTETVEFFQKSSVNNVSPSVNTNSNDTISKPSSDNSSSFQAPSSDNSSSFHAPSSDNSSSFQAPSSDNSSSFQAPSSAIIPASTPVFISRAGDPVVVMYPDNGGFQVFARGEDNRIYHMWSDRWNWQSPDWAYVGGTTDNDGDGLLNVWEQHGIDINNDGQIDLILPGANPLHKDIYIEVDFMQFHRPRDISIN